MKKAIFTLLVLVCITNSSGQNILYGIIVSRADQLPLEATIYFPSLEKGTLSDLDGNYTISNIPAGTFTLIVTLMGYASVSKAIEFPERTSEDQEPSLTLYNIQLDEIAIEMDEVIISTPFHKLQKENVMKVERISNEQLHQTGSFNLSSGISSIPGVESISTGTGIGKPVIRGLSANRIVTYTQGIRLENQQFGDEHGLGINGNGVESVEVIKGPASLLYGSDALGGVLYINPEKFAAANSTERKINSTFHFNTMGTSNSLGLKQSNERFKFLVRGTYENHLDYQIPDEKSVLNTRYNETDFKTGFRYQNGHFKSTLRYNYNRANIGIPEGKLSNGKGSRRLTPFQTIDNHVLSLDHRVFLKSSSLDVKLGYLFNDRREFEELNEQALRLKLNTINYDLKYNFPKGKHLETIVGIQGSYQTNENRGKEVLIPDAEKLDIGLLGTAHYHLKKIDFQGGLRIDTRRIKTKDFSTPEALEYIAAIDRDFTSINAAIGARADLFEGSIARLNFATGFRAPNLAELGSNGVHEGTNRYEVGNPVLKNEQNLQVDVSLEYASKHIELYVNGFYNAIDDYIFITPTDETLEGSSVFQYVQANAALYGGEFGVHVHPHPLDWLHFESSFETIIAQQENDDYLPLIPANSINNTLRVEWNSKNKNSDWYLFTTSKFTFDQDKISIFETSSEGYHLLSTGGGFNYKGKNFLINTGVHVSNLTNETYISHLSRLKPEGLPNMGRNISLRLGLTI